MNSNRPLSTRKTIQLFVFLMILAGATQTMIRQLGSVSAGHLLLAGVLSSNSTPEIRPYHFEQGGLENTGNALDVGIQGNGYFRVKLASGYHPQFGYTRVGQFFVNNANRLVVGVGNGYELVPPITIPTGVINIHIATDGTISGLKPGQTARALLGQFKLDRFANPDGLREVQDDVYQPTSDSGAPIEGNPDVPGPDGYGQLCQHYLESLAGK